MKGIFILILAILSLSVCHQQLTFSIQARTNSTVLFSNSITLQYGNSHTNPQPLELEVPLQLLTQTYIQVSLLYPENSTAAQTKTYKLTKQMFPARTNYGIQKWFGIDNIVMSNEIDVEQVYPSALYLKVAYPAQEDQQAKSLKKIPFTIDQSLILNYKQFKAVSRATTPVVKFHFFPQLFEADYFYSSRLISNMSEYNNYFEKYFIKSRNKKIGEEDFKMIKQLNTYHKQSTLEMIKELKEPGQNSQFSKDAVKLLQEELRHIEFRFGQIKKLELMIQQQSNHVFSMVKNILINSAFDYIQIAKKCIFFDYFQYYLVLVPISLFLTAASLVGNYTFLFAMLCGKFNNYQDHMGMTLVSIYIFLSGQIIAVLVLDNMAAKVTPFIVIFLPAILKLQFESTASFPYFKPKTHYRYEHLNASDTFLSIVMGLACLLLLIGNYLFFARKVKYSQQASLDKFNTFEIIMLIIDNYLFFFIAFAQIYTNQKLQSVRHLTKGYVLLYFVNAISDDFAILFETELFYVLFILKEDIMAAILVWQCMKWGDLGIGSRKYYRQKFMDEELAKRQAELLSLC